MKWSTLIVDENTNSQNINKKNVYIYIIEFCVNDLSFVKIGCGYSYRIIKMKNNISRTIGSNSINQIMISEVNKRDIEFQIHKLLTNRRFWLRKYCRLAFDGASEVFYGDSISVINEINKMFDFINQIIYNETNKKQIKRLSIKYKSTKLPIQKSVFINESNHISKIIEQYKNGNNCIIEKDFKHYFDKIALLKVPYYLR